MNSCAPYFTSISFKKALISWAKDFSAFLSYSQFKLWFSLIKEIILTLSALLQESPYPTIP